MRDYGIGCNELLLKCDRCGKIARYSGDETDCNTLAGADGWLNGNTVNGSNTITTYCSSQCFMDSLDKQSVNS